MDHAKKFILMPMDRAQHFSEEHISELDQEMQTILSRKMSDPEKAKLYLQVLQKFVKFPEMNQAKPVTQEPEISDSHPPDIKKDVTESAPVKHKKVAKNILLFLESRPDVFSWTPAKELVLHGNILPHTNIEVLISHLIRNKKLKPLGFDQFQSALKETNFPESFVKNTHLHEKQLQQKKLYALPVRTKRKSNYGKPMYGKGSSWLHL